MRGRGDPRSGWTRPAVLPSGALAAVSITVALPANQPPVASQHQLIRALGEKIPLYVDLRINKSHPMEIRRTITMSRRRGRGGETRRPRWSIAYQFTRKISDGPGGPATVADTIRRGLSPVALDQGWSVGRFVDPGSMTAPTDLK